MTLNWNSKFFFSLSFFFFLTISFFFFFFPLQNCKYDIEKAEFYFCSWILTEVQLMYLTCLVFCFLFFSFSCVFICWSVNSLWKKRKEKRRRIKTRQVTVPGVDAELGPCRSDGIGYDSHQRGICSDWLWQDVRWHHASDWSEDEIWMRSSISSVHGDEQIFILFYAE